MVKILKLDMISAAKNSDSLVKLLQDSVKNGASVSFLNPLSDSAAESYWREVFAEINSAQIIVWAAFDDDDNLVGSVQLAPAKMQNAKHRAMVQKLMVISNHRREGIGSALMDTLEFEAKKLGKKLLILDTRLGDPSETLYEQKDYIKFGIVPGYALNSSNDFDDMAFYFKII